MAMNGRRKALAFLGINAAVAAAAALPRAVRASAAAAPVSAEAAQLAEQHRRYFPNVPLRTHRGQDVRFYDDLVKGKKVIINFTYTGCTGTCPLTTSNLARVQKLLGDRVGRDIFIVSLTLDPENDTPDVLDEYAKAHNAGPGWTFATGRQEDIDSIRRRLGLYDTPDFTQHLGLLTFGNEPEGKWAAGPALDRPENILYYVLRRVDTFKATEWPARPSAKAASQGGTK
jgi:protein SCO1/2